MGPTGPLAAVERSFRRGLVQYLSNLKPLEGAPAPPVAIMTRYTVEGEISSLGPSQRGPYLVTLRMWDVTGQPRRLIAQAAGTAERYIHLADNFAHDPLVHPLGLVGQMGNVLAVALEEAGRSGQPGATVDALRRASDFPPVTLSAGRADTSNALAVRGFVAHTTLLRRTASGFVVIGDDADTGTPVHIGRPKSAGIDSRAADQYVAVVEFVPAAGISDVGSAAPPVQVVGSVRGIGEAADLLGHGASGQAIPPTGKGADALASLLGRLHPGSRCFAVLPLDGTDAPSTVSGITGIVGHTGIRDAVNGDLPPPPQEWTHPDPKILVLNPERVLTNIHVGDELTFGVIVGADGYVLLWDQGPAGGGGAEGANAPSVRQLFPGGNNVDVEAARVVRGRTYRIPRDDGQAYVPDRPGSERIIALWVERREDAMMLLAASTGGSAQPALPELKPQGRYCTASVSFAVRKAP